VKAGLFLDEYGGPTLFTLVAPFVILIGLFLGLAYRTEQAQEAEYARLMEACLQDRKEYECVSMMRRPKSDVMPVPVFIPVR
jgi:hypothetical protein